MVTLLGAESLLVPVRSVNGIPNTSEEKSDEIFEFYLLTNIGSVFITERRGDFLHVVSVLDRESTGRSDMFFIHCTVYIFS